MTMIRSRAQLVERKERFWKAGPSPEFYGLQGIEVSRPLVQRTAVRFLKAPASDVTWNQAERRAELASANEVLDHCPGFVLQTLAQAEGREVGPNLVAVPHLVLEGIGDIVSAGDIDLLSEIIDHGLLYGGERWTVIPNSAAAQRQGKLFLWPERITADQRLDLLLGENRKLWDGVKLVPSKYIAYIGLGFSSLIGDVDGAEVFKGMKLQFLKDVSVLNRQHWAVKDGHKKTSPRVIQKITDGLVAVGSEIMRRIEKGLGYPVGTIHAVQFRGGLGAGLKGLMVEAPWIDQRGVLVFQSASKLLKVEKDYEQLARVLLEGRLGICRVSRLPDSLTGVTTISNQVVGLLPKETFDALGMAKQAAAWAAEQIGNPDAVRKLLGMTADENDPEAMFDALQDGDAIRAALIANGELALKSRLIRRKVAALLERKIKDQCLFGNLIVGGYDLWICPEPAVIKAAWDGLFAQHELTAEQVEAMEGGEEKKDWIGCVPVEKLDQILGPIARRIGYEPLGEEEILWAGCPEEMVGSDVAVIRHPLQHPGQMGVAKLKKLPRSGLWGLAFLPARGVYQAVLGGADFDGDEIKLITGPLATAVKQARKRYLILPPDGVAEKVVITEGRHDEVLKQVLKRAAKGVGQVGILSNQASAVTALTADPRTRERLQCNLAYLVMVAVDAVKTGIFPNDMAGEVIDGADLENSPLCFRNGRLTVKYLEYPQRDKPVWLGVLPEYRHLQVSRDLTAMGSLFMGAHEVMRAFNPRGGSEDRVIEQFTLVAAKLVADPDALKPDAHFLITLYPEEWDEVLDQLRTLRNQLAEAELMRNRSLVKSLKAEIKDAQGRLSTLMAPAIAKARGYVEALPENERLALTAVLFAMKPTAAWAFCRPEVVQLLAKVKDESLEFRPVPMEVPRETIKLMGYGLEGMPATKEEAAARLQGATVTFREDQGYIRCFIGEERMGGLANGYELLAPKLVGKELVVATAKPVLNQKAVMITFQQREKADPAAVWLERTLQRIRNCMDRDSLNRLVGLIAQEGKQLALTDAIKQRINEAVRAQRATIRSGEAHNETEAVLVSEDSFGFSD